MAQAPAEKVSSVPCHLSGITRLSFSPDGATIFTGGSDCLVRIHKADDPDSEPGFHDNHTDEITSLSCSSSNLVTGSKDNIARIFSYPANEFEGFVTRSSGVPIRWVSVDKAGERVAVCSDDLLVKIVHVKDTSRQSLLSDNAKPVRSATWDPSGKYLVTASCDGKLKVYDMTSSTPLNLKIIDGVIGPSESDSDVSCYAAWHPSGNFFAVPLRTNDIGIISREGWSKQATFSQDGHKSAVGELAFSPNGKYLASSSGSTVLVWSTETRTVISRHTVPEGSISGLTWSPKSNLLAFTSLDGSFHRWVDPVPSELPSPVTTEAQAAKRLDKLLDDEFDAEEDEDIEEKGEDLEGQYGDDWIVDDDGQYAADDDEQKWSKGRTEVVNVTKAQQPFTPGSTAMKNKKRYLAFNMIGVVDVTDQETHNVINVEFHDKSARRGYHFQDHSKFTMASLGEQGVVFAAASEDESPSTVYYRPYDSWASQSDWTVSLLPGEDAVVVAAGGSAGDGMGSIVVATSKGFLRFFTSSGIQRYVWSLGEEVVTMAAGKEAVIIVHREGGTSLDGCQNLRYSIMDFDTFEIVQEGRIPLPKKVTLTWLGFTAEGAPAMYDSSGLLSILDRYRRFGQARWVPLLDSRTLQKEGRQENYWPVGVTDSHFTCVILKGSDKEPWFPRPLIQELEMRMPLLNMDNQHGKLEESVVRGNVRVSLLSDLDLDDSTLKATEVALDKELLQLVQGACKADNLSRALDAARMMRFPATIDAAAKIAAFYHLPGLEERIHGVKSENELRRRRQEKERRSRKSDIANVYAPPLASGVAGGSARRQFADFAPRGGARRSFGGANGANGATGASGVSRAETPMNEPSGKAETYIPETPGNEAGTLPLLSPETKRKRDDENGVSEWGTATTKKRNEEPSAHGGKNPFAAKKSGGANPFAKPAVAKPLDAIKSTSFFERVDDIESSGAKPKAKAPKAKATEGKANGGSTGAGGKQTTLFGMKKAPQRHQESISTETDETQGDDDESQAHVGVLEDSLVQETLLSPEPMDED